jgi:hypothetical protein
VSYAFANPVDICNRALQHCGARRITATTLGTEQSVQSQECTFAYDKLRLAEMERNLWTFAIRRAALRAIDLSTQIITFPVYASGTTYGLGAIVQYPTSSGNFWLSNQASNVGNTPGLYQTAGYSGQVAWQQYFGPLTADLWNWNSAAGATNTTNGNYSAGELVYMVPSTPDGTFKLYTALLNNTTNQPTAVDAWVNNLLYSSGAVVSYAGTNYQSLINMNLNNTPVNGTIWTTTVTNPTVSGSWLQVSSPTLSYLPISFPLTTGPYSDTTSQNAYRLPAGFLRAAPQAPKEGAYRYLGGPSRLIPDDWERNGQYIVSGKTDRLILFRFVADVQDVTLMNNMFCEGLACRIALEVWPRVTQDRPNIAALNSQYRQFMQEARDTNAIEQGPTEQPEDSYITCRY